MKLEVDEIVALYDNEDEEVTQLIVETLAVCALGQLPGSAVQGAIMTGYALGRKREKRESAMTFIVREEPTDAKFRGRRPYWTKVDVSVPSCEVFKIRLTSTTAWEFVGIQFAVESRDTGGANVPA